MPISITDHATEESTFPIEVSFTDDAGDPVIPNVITWHLTDRDGTVINSREDVNVAIPAATITVVLQGDDLVLDDSDNNLRILTIEATYNSTLGNDLPFKEEFRFYIDNLVKIPN